MGNKIAYFMSCTSGIKTISNIETHYR